MNLRKSRSKTRPRYTVYVLREALLQSGIAVAGDPVDVDALSIKPAYETPSHRRVAIHRSAALPEIASLINKPSQNLYADLLMKMLGVALPQESSDLDPGSAAMGIETAMNTFARARRRHERHPAGGWVGTVALEPYCAGDDHCAPGLHVDAPGPAGCAMRFTIHSPSQEKTDH